MGHICHPTGQDLWDLFSRHPLSEEAASLEVPANPVRTILHMVISVLLVMLGAGGTKQPGVPETLTLNRRVATAVQDDNIGSKEKA